MKSIILLLASLLLSIQLNAQNLPQVLPEQVGMDSKRLLQADLIIHKAIANKEIPGAVLAIVKNGKMAYLKSYGNKEVYPHTVAMDVNTVFDLASVTKPMATAILSLNKA